MKDISTKINASLVDANLSESRVLQLSDENTVVGYLQRHFIDSPSIKRIYPDHPLLPEPNVQSRKQIQKDVEAIQQMLEKGEIDGKEAFVKTVILVDDYFNTLDAEEVKHISQIASEGSRNDLYTDE